MDKVISHWGIDHIPLIIIGDYMIALISPTDKGHVIDPLRNRKCIVIGNDEILDELW